MRKWNLDRMEVDAVWRNKCDNERQSGNWRGEGKERVVENQVSIKLTNDCMETDQYGWMGLGNVRGRKLKKLWKGNVSE